MQLRHYDSKVQQIANTPTQPSQSQDSYNVYDLLSDDLVESNSGFSPNSLEVEWTKYCSGIDKPDLQGSDILHWWQVRSF